MKHSGLASPGNLPTAEASLRVTHTDNAEADTKLKVAAMTYMHRQLVAKTDKVAPYFADLCDLKGTWWMVVVN